MVRVTSEIGRLRRVLVHEPGPEVDRMVPPMMEELLFDDILFGERAREEHGRFRRLMKLLDIDVVEARSLLAEALAQPEAQDWLTRVIQIEAPMEAEALTTDIGTEAILATVVEGVLRSGLDDGRGIEVSDLFRLTPLPNWCFQRDPQVVVGEGVIFSAMATPARWREGILSRCIFHFHPEFRDTKVLADPLRPDWDPTHLLGLHRPRLEGGDVLVLAPDVLAVGVSERTNMQAVEILVDALSRRDDAPRWLEVVQLPARRAYMHLDTVFTPADHDAALLYAPVMTGSGPEAAVTYEVDLHADDPRPVHRGEFLPTITARGVDLEPIPCGGRDPVAAQREQWTDGANTVALAPGIITLYDRNVATAATLDAHGFRILDAEDVLLGRRDFSLDQPGRCCLLLASHEISRARGGPHCLTHPLVRDDLG
jgi:arginine deiminase